MFFLRILRLITDTRFHSNREHLSLCYSFRYFVCLDLREGNAFVVLRNIGDVKGMGTESEIERWGGLVLRASEYEGRCR